MHTVELPEPSIKWDEEYQLAEWWSKSRKETVGPFCLELLPVLPLSFSLGLTLFPS